MSTSKVLQRFYSLNTFSPDVSRCLYYLFRSDDEEHYLTTLQGSELTRLVDFLDELTEQISQILDVTLNTDDAFQRCLHKLRTICGHRVILPSSYTISGDLSRVGNDPVSGGSFSDVWKGTHNSCKSFCKEAITWKRLEHPNVVAFIGVTRNPLQIVSEWMPNGTLREYVNKNPGVNRVGLPNVLIDCTGHACLADFGLASVVRGLGSVLITEVQGYTKRWAAPEVLGSGDRSTREADVFAFGMVVMKVFTGKSPFSEFNHNVTVLKIISGEQPDRPRKTGLTNSVWELTLACWQQDPACRPAMAEVVGILREWPGLANKKEGPKGDRYIELLRLCTLWHTVPTSYELGDVMRQGDSALQVSGVTEIWEGLYDGEVVALKVLRLPQNNDEAAGERKECEDDSHAMTYEQRFCAAAVLMKQIEHANILPFYGVSMTISDFSLVFPWYKNGDIKQYLKTNPHVDRYDLASTSKLIEYSRHSREPHKQLLSAVKGLRFLHSNGAVHGAFWPDHILIDDDGNAQLTIAIPDTPTIAISDKSTIAALLSRHTRLAGTSDFPYGVPEIKSMESDVYEMAIVIYEVLTGIATYWSGRNYDRAFPVMPAQPPGAFDDLFWGLLAKCWRRSTQEHPPIDEVYHGQPPSQEYYVRFKCRNAEYTTSPINLRNDWGKYTWKSPQNWVTETVGL
ncbi:kinase-like domain-containing protein [Thelephora terrestris]|uniref:Kinase-like domain-containing protein n=1 Tax=Thelephora terrestris TaxID=56493 RepID=A0A9P6HG49_9AGAM|nr:kinase-like domain-containing protein [Thelephora terrestris]